MAPPFEREVDGVLLGERQPLLRSQELAHQSVRVGWREPLLVVTDQTTIDAQRGRRAGAQHQVGSAALKKRVEKLADGDRGHTRSQSLPRPLSLMQML